MWPADKSSYYPGGVVGLVDATDSKVTPLKFPNAEIVTELYDLIETWEDVSNTLAPASPQEDVDQVEILAPLVGRDILAIGKNYQAHAK
jgi:2-keto-4-pentenoate hydratase/2-oxohepta-3-ene-1,7-dioic acid hydratase in catechol pathway